MLYNIKVGSDTTQKTDIDSIAKILFGGNTVINLTNEKALLFQIAIKRKIMYKKAKNYGFTHPAVVECSQELDVLLNKYQKIAS